CSCRVLPAPEGCCVPTELRARASQPGLAVVEVPIGPPSEVTKRTPETWRALLGSLTALASAWWSQVQFPGPPPAPARSWREPLLVLLLAALLLFTHLNQQPLLDPDEGRQAEVAREMLAHHDWVVPRLLGDPYSEKPPLQYWLTTLAYRACGIQPWSARLVPAGAAWWSVLVTLLWGRFALGSRPAWLGGLVLSLTLGFIVLGRMAVLDSLLACC